MKAVTGSHEQLAARLCFPLIVHQHDLEILLLHRLCEQSAFGHALQCHLCESSSILRELPGCLGRSTRVTAMSETKFTELASGAQNGRTQKRRKYRDFH